MTTNSPLIDRLEATHRRRCAVQRRARGLNALAAWLGLGLALCAADAAWSLGGWWAMPQPGAVYELPTWWRAIAAAAIAAGLLAAPLRLRLPKTTRRFNPAREALACERALGLAGNGLVNAVQLADDRGDADDRDPNGAGHRVGRDPTERTDLTRALASRAAARGEALADRINPASIIDARPSRRAARRAAAVLAVAVALFAVTPWLGGRTGLHHAAARCLLPLADHPPAAWIDLDLSIAPAPVVAGEPLTLRVEARGGAPAHAALDLSSRRDGSTLRIALADAGGVGVGERRLAGLDAPLGAQARAGGARTRAIRIDPVTRPRITGVALAARHDDRRVALRWPPPTPLRARIGATIELTVRSNVGSATLDHPEAAGRRLAITVEPGRRTLEATLVGEAGVRSTQSVRLTIEGATPADLADLADRAATATIGGATPAADAMFAEARGLVAPDALSTASAAGEPTVAMASDLGGEATEGAIGEGEGEGEVRPDGGEPSNGGGRGDAGANDGEGDGDAGRGGGEGGGMGGDPPRRAASEAGQAVGEVLRRMGAGEAERREVERRADRAPAAYRADVAAYFLRIMRESKAP